MSYRAINQYKTNTVATSSPEELTLMLYNGAIKFMNIARMRMEENNIEEKNQALIKAQNIIIELKASLDMSYELAGGMEALYDFILDRLIDANIYNKPRSIDDALEITGEMRDTWKEAMEIVKKNRFSRAE